MARPKNIVPTVALTVRIPVTTFSKLQLHLLSEVEGRVPHGAYGQLLTTLIDMYLEAGKPTTSFIDAEMQSKTTD